MKKRVVSLVTILALLALIFSVVAFSGSAPTPQRGSANSSQGRLKKLREIALERDVEVEGVSEAHSEYTTFESLRKEAKAIVYGRIVDSRSFFDESGHPIEYGEIITTEYTVEVLRVLKNSTLQSMPPPDKPAPASLSTPLKIARNGGVVYVNGHRAAVNVKGFESLAAGKQYVFFLFWSPDYKAYLLAGGISGAVMVNADLSLKPLASSETIKAKLHTADLETLANEVGRP